MSNRLSTVEGLEIQAPPMVDGERAIDHPSHTSESRVNKLTLIQINIADPFITKTGACCNLFCNYGIVTCIKLALSKQHGINIAVFLQCLLQKLHKV
ncbi:hypothetical protein DPMN_066171 [Dreissena polymorpha]|uniref:Uncharacterized protein n=1 Tax=Dreissena polymorpha TaxID=45954 RepID=A0A9D3YWU5_DREPO|nr:hypothetical protein DPMN_066171 [Dreissena polymorpha]